MTKEVSLYFDLSRFIAAFLVMVYHFSYERFSGGLYPMYFGHEAVIVFFILSGYVISFVADTKEDNFKSYFISRFSRLYSVVLPVLVLIPVFDIVGQYIDSSLYVGKTADSYYIIRLIANLTFSQEFWMFSFRYLSDGPLWSLGYEFWYYVLFGFSIFLKGKKKYIILTLTTLLIGPKILLLLPVWLFGVWIYGFHKNNSLDKSIARIIFFIIPIAFLYCFTYYNEINQFIYSIIGDDIKSKLGFSAGFITDYITGFFVGLHILSVKYINIVSLNKMLGGGRKVIRFFANSSFSIYLFHFPIFLFFAALLNHNPNSILDIIILFSITLASCLALAQVTENKKHIYKKYITILWEKVESRIKK
ncbi:acyltransferase family protein [Poseidonibacter ostreae]|uniref:Acyltransferase family protein n=1 Tax=Poseidonibacter ostreae TaxID=2654171 RepID=A0ABQ6VPN0_9BACT|nr:acyltransferase [Poseidonibacter ostreae]KAB7892668.1 acyltransferase family protein [Poseidonibacter ostreae]